MDGGRHPGGPDPAERRHPLPGLAGLPGHLLGGLPPPVRRVLGALAVLLALVAGAGALVVVPSSREDARRLEAEERARQQATRRESVRLAGPIRRARCSPFPPSVRSPAPEDVRGRGRGRYECLAATRDFGATEGTEAGSLGHPYRALVDFDAARYAFCKISMRPGEGGLTRPSAAAVPRACGGADAGPDRR